MSFFKDFKDDLSQAVNELMPEEGASQAAPQMVDTISETSAPIGQDDLAELINVKKYQSDIININTANQQVICAAVEKPGHRIMKRFISQLSSCLPAVSQKIIIITGNKPQFFSTGRFVRHLRAHISYQIGQRLTDLCSDKEDKDKHNYQKSQYKNRLHSQQQQHLI